MNQLLTNDIIALSLLFDDQIYHIDNEEILTEGTPELEIKEQNITPISSPQKKQIVENKTIHFDYLGENNKYILIIVNHPNIKFLDKASQDFLIKIMAAKKWALEDVAIVNLATYKTLNFTDLKNFFACSKIITFGFNPALLNIEGAIANQKVQFKDVAVLGTWDLAKLQADVNKKTIFWNQLKTL